MRAFRFLLLALSVWLISAIGLGGKAYALGPLDRSAPVLNRQLLLDAKLVCGFEGGSFGCHQESGDIEMGKNRTPGTSVQEQDTATPPPPPAADTWQSTTNPAGGASAPPPQGTAEGAQPLQPGAHACPAGYTVLAVPGPNGYCQPPRTAAPAAAAAATAGACLHGMQGTPPNCHCPPSSELLGGNCVHYTATCKTALAADAPPQTCPKDDQRLACKTRPDGLKDCCCLTYDKL